jgi:hypothetical protein
MRKFISQMDPNGQFIIWWIHCFFWVGHILSKSQLAWNTMAAHVYVSLLQQSPNRKLDPLGYQEHRMYRQRSLWTAWLLGDFIDVPHTKIATMIEGTLQLDRTVIRVETTC